MKIIELYNDILAEKYDEAILKGEWKASSESHKILRQTGLIKRGLRILDLGIGTGQSVKPFQNKDCKIYGVDISKKMLKVSKQKYSRLKTFKYDISKRLKGLNFKNKYFDLVIAVGVLEFIKNIKKIIKETKQLLKPGGYFIFTYELLLPNYKFQKAKVQYNAEGYIKNPPRILKFRLYRRSKKEINKILKVVGYKIIRHFKIKSFLKGPARIPVYYGLVLVQNEK